MPSKYYQNRQKFRRLIYVSVSDECVVTVPGNAFGQYGEGYYVFHLLPLDMIKQGMEKLRKVSKAIVYRSVLHILINADNCQIKEEQNDNQFSAVSELTEGGRQRVVIAGGEDLKH